MTENYTDRMTMRFQRSIDIDAPAADVWDIIVDVENWPSWTESVTRVDLLDGGPVAVGSRANLTYPPLPRQMWTVAALTPGESFEWELLTRGLRTLARYAVHAREGGGSRAELSLVQAGWLAPVIGLVMGRRNRRDQRMEAEGLKRRAEAAHAR